MAAAPADFRAAEVHRASSPATARSTLQPRADRGHPRRAHRRPTARSRRSSASPPSTARARRARPRQACAQGRRPDRSQRRRRPRDRLRERGERGDPDRRGERDHVAGSEGTCRRIEIADDDPRPGRSSLRVQRPLGFPPSASYTGRKLLSRSSPSFEKWAWPTFFSSRTYEDLQQDIQRSFASSIPSSTWSPSSSPARKRCASSSTTRGASTWRSAKR